MSIAKVEFVKVLANVEDYAIINTNFKNLKNDERAK